jgi:ATP-dependent helicase/nuclease subunit A
MRTPRETQWTEAQRRGIVTTGRSVLVSAAAGSGKTAMLAERCAYLVCDAPDACDLDELVVVTFTEAAAAEMKNRIHSRLRRRLAEKPSERLRHQLDFIDHANVSTLHSFCGRLLREHFHAVGLDPAFTVLDDEEAGLLRREVARALFDSRYELDESGDFHRFIDAYTEGDDAGLIRKVIHTHQMLESLVDPAAWIDDARRAIADATGGELTHSELGEELVRMIRRTIADVRGRCGRAVKYVQSLGDFPAYLEALDGCARGLRYWNELVTGEGIDALAEHVRNFAHLKLRAVSNSIPGKEQAKKAVDSVREAMTKGALVDLLRFSESQWQEGLAAITPHVNVFLRLVEDFGMRYRSAKDAARVVDFADLERFALRVLSEHRNGRLVASPAARAYRRRFAHVLVDEYQDINEIQDAILSLLSREAMGDESDEPWNLFSVGDVKQSIYRFRLAETGRFLERQRQFNRDRQKRFGEVIDLQSNFRSRSPLLEAINGVFERIMAAEAVEIEYDQSHRLAAGLAYPTTQDGSCFRGAPIELHILPEDRGGEDQDDSSSEDDLELDRSEREALLVARRIRQFIGADGSAPMSVTEKDDSGAFRTRPIRHRDIVVLLRATKYKSEQYAEVLRRAGIPVHAQSSTGYFESTEISDVLSVLSLLENQRQDIPLAAMLRSPLAKLAEPENAFARIRLAYATRGDKAIPFHDAAVRYSQEHSDDLALSLRDFFSRLSRWRHLASSRPLADVIAEIYQSTGYLAFCAGLHDGEQRVANLKDLEHRAAQFGSFRRQGLSRFMQLLKSLREETDLGQPSTASEAEDVVRVMSIHRAKGLEFPVVIVPDLGKRINLSDAYGAIVADRSAGLGMAIVDEHRMIRYPSLASVLVQRRVKQQALAEEMRVLYVAMTRAKEHLVLIGTCTDKMFDSWIDRWSGFEGAFPSDMILSAKTMLDWLGPVSAAAGQGILQIHHHTSDEVTSWQTAHAKRPQLSPEQSRLARLEPLKVVVENPVANHVIARLDYRYPFEAFTRLPAAQAVTNESSKPKPIELPLPAFLAEARPTRADIGTATHRVLLHLDFSRPCRADDLAAQIQDMIDRRLLSGTQANQIDRGAVEWLIETETGKLLKAHARDLRREVPVHFAAAPQGLSSSDPLDRIMVRGRIDVLVPTARGIILIDYKTDDIPADAVLPRARLYEPQIQQYRQAVEQMTGRPVAAAQIVFLGPRLIHAL